MEKEYWNPMVPELSVANFETSMRFYTEVLGFSVKYQRSNPDFAYLEFGQAQLMIEQLSDGCWSTGDLEYPFGRGINLQIEVSDISGIYSNLRSNGYELFREPKENCYKTDAGLSGQKEFLVQDPDGYLLRFCQHLGDK